MLDHLVQHITTIVLFTAVKWVVAVPVIFASIKPIVTNMVTQASDQPSVDITVAIAAVDLSCGGDTSV